MLAIHELDISFCKNSSQCPNTDVWSLFLAGKVAELSSGEFGLSQPPSAKETNSLSRSDCRHIYFVESNLDKLWVECYSNKEETALACLGTYGCLVTQSATGGRAGWQAG